MATFTKFNCFVYHLGRGYHNLDAANHVVKVYLTNGTPDAQNDVWLADLASITQANGYNATDIQQSWTQNNNITELTSGVANVTWTATGGNFGPFRYVGLYNDNATDGANVDALMCYWDYGSAISCNNGESFTWDPPANNLIANIT
jgi:hypothetical protein